MAYNINKGLVMGSKKGNLEIFWLFFLLILLIQSFLIPISAQEDEATYFTIHFLVSSSEEDLLKAAQLIVSDMWKIGIDARLKIFPESNVNTRYQHNPGHLWFDEGGFDVVFYGVYDGLSAPSTLLQFFHSDNIGKGFRNFFPVQNSLLDRRLNLLQTTADFQARVQLVELILDQLVWDIHPMTNIYQEEEFFAIDVDLSGFDPVQMRMERVELLDEATTVSLAGRPIFDFNPFITYHYYDCIFAQQLFDGLMGADEDRNYYPLIANGSPVPLHGYNRVIGRNVDEGEGLLWEVKIRNDIYWHDGYGYTNETLRVDDVVFSYKSALSGKVAPPFLSIFEKVFGYESKELPFEILDNYTLRFHLSEDIRELPSLYGRKPEHLGKSLKSDLFFSDRFLDMPSVFSLPILPRHILDPDYNSTGEGTDLGGPGMTADGAPILSLYSSRTNDFNLGKRSGGYEGRAVIGTGPYQFNSINTTEQYIETSAFPLYYKTQVDGEYISKPDFFRYYYGFDRYEAENALIEGRINVIDSHFDLLDDIPFLLSHPTIQITEKWGWQMYGLGYNTFNPYLVDRNVRLAISHLIDRTEITDYILGGLAHPAFAPLPEQSPYWSENIPRISLNLTKAWDYMEKAGYDMDTLRKQISGKEKTSSNSMPFVLIVLAVVTLSIFKKKKRD